MADSAGTTQESYLQSLNAAGGLCASNPITEILAASTAQELADLATNRADAVLNDNITDAFDAQTMGGAVEAVNYPAIESGPYGIGIPKDDVHLLKAVDGALGVLMKGGATSTYKEILNAWNVGSVSIPAPVINGCAKPLYRQFC